MKDGVQKLFVRIGLESKELSECMIAVSKPLSKDDADMDSPVFQKCMREAVNRRRPVEVYDLTEEERELIKLLCSKELVGEKHRAGGLDGHRYYVKYVVNGEERKYDCWSIVPKEWDALYEVIQICLGKIPVLPASECAYIPHMEE